MLMGARIGIAHFLMAWRTARGNVVYPFDLTFARDRRLAMSLRQ